MRTGQLRHKIRIEQVTETRTNSGAIAETWGNFKTVRAEVIPQSGREYFNNSQVSSQETARFNIHYTPGITTKMRIIFNNRTYDIHEVINNREHNRFITMVGVEYVQ